MASKASPPHIGHSTFGDATFSVAAITYLPLPAPHSRHADDADYLLPEATHILPRPLFATRPDAFRRRAADDLICRSR